MHILHILFELMKFLTSGLFFMACAFLALSVIFLVQGASKIKTLRPWYTPAGAIAKLSALLISSGDPALQAMGIFSYGAFDLLGVKGTMKLILKLRRKHASTSKKAKRSK